MTTTIGGGFLRYTKETYEATPWELKTFCSINMSAFTEAAGGPNLAYYYNKERTRKTQHSVEQIHNHLNSGHYDSENIHFVKTDYKTAALYAGDSGIALAINTAYRDPIDDHVAPLAYNSVTDQIEVYNVGSTYQPGFMSLKKSFGTAGKIEYYIMVGAER